MFLLKIAMGIIILLVPVYFLFMFIFSKRNVGNKKSRKYIAIIPTIIVSPIIYLMVILIWIFSMSYYPKEKFDSIKWNKNIEERYKMAKDIIEKNILIGKTKDEVIKLLGNDYYESEEGTISYYLGLVPGLANIDPDVLVLYFENGIVVKVEQINT
jgi:heme/copper-type cytochrome/quinol oxidase subunit 2